MNIYENKYSLIKKCSLFQFDKSSKQTLNFDRTENWSNGLRFS